MMIFVMNIVIDQFVYSVILEKICIESLKTKHALDCNQIQEAKIMIKYGIMAETGSLSVLCVAGVLSFV